MNNKQNNRDRQALDTSRQKTGGMYENFINQTKGQYGKDLSDSNNLRDEIFNRYTNTNNFMPSGINPNSTGWFDLPEGFGGASGSGSSSGSSSHGAMPDFSGTSGGYKNFAETGGINRGDFNPALDSYKGFMENGGLGESQKDNMRYRATSMVPAFFDKYKDELKRRSNVQGGYSPGYDAQMSKIGRDAGREGYNASRMAEADIADREIEGRKFGTSGFGDLMTNISGMEQQGKLAGLSGLDSQANSTASFANANRNADSADRNATLNRNMAMQQFLMDMYSTGERTRASGLQSLYSSAPGTVGQTGGLYLGGLGGYSGNELNNLGARTAIKDRSWMDLIPGLVGAGGAVATGFGLGGYGASGNTGYAGGRR